MNALARLLVIVWLVVGVAASGGCSSVDADHVSQLAFPDRDAFKTHVSPFLERTCGALDCHGQSARPLRLYSQLGLRLEARDGGARDTSPTNDRELTANYFAVVGLEPEDVSDAVVSQGAHRDFLLLKKPLGIEGGGVRHKGGPVLRLTDAGYECLASWLAGRVNVASCTAGAQP